MSVVGESFKKYFKRILIFFIKTFQSEKKVERNRSPNKLKENLFYLRSALV